MFDPIEVPPPPGPVVEFAQHVGRLHSLLDRVVVSAAGSCHLSRAEFDVLVALAAQSDGLRPRQLSEGLLLTTGGLSNILRRLQREGYIERQCEPSDRRGRMIRITATGMALAREATFRVNASIERLLAPIDRMHLDQANAHLHLMLSDLGEDGPVHRLQGKVCPAQQGKQ
ncbi:MULTISPECIES: MarR family winged helix-turn-helix transcriptional regulator [Streptomyces]|uniref:MarR family winged helix-turn-helix transcriptional regulator n=1 Tax=Streptomyces TaxID=1883 RepID=UPI0007DB3480|nr:MULTISPECIES: MarR family transcriptional regulator [unclassified Streptomyces]MCO8307816.1 MarR family transcriptional regulator [Streptomyces sp. RKCA744]